MGRKRKTRVTKEQRVEMQELSKVKAKKNVIIPGPWTDLQTDLVIKHPELRLTHSITFDLFGAYTNYDVWKEKGWYPILINITSDDIYQKVKKYDLDQYLAAWEKAINSETNKKIYGTIVILEPTIDHSLDEDETHRFISCKAKTNRKSIKGFSAIRSGKYIRIGDEEQKI